MNASKRISRTIVSLARTGFETHIKNEITRLKIDPYWFSVIVVSSVRT